MMTVKSTKKKPVVEKARKVVPFITRHRPNRFSDMIGMESQLNTLAVSIELAKVLSSDSIPIISENRIGR